MCVRVASYELDVIRTTKVAQKPGVFAAASNFTVASIAVLGPIDATSKLPTTLRFIFFLLSLLSLSLSVTVSRREREREREDE
jgi:hypothetical protein